MAKQDHTINRDEPSERAVERKRLTGDIRPTYAFVPMLPMPSQRHVRPRWRVPLRQC